MWLKDSKAWLRDMKETSKVDNLNFKMQAYVRVCKESKLEE